MRTSSLAIVLSLALIGCKEKEAAKAPPPPPAEPPAAVAEPAPPPAAEQPPTGGSGGSENAVADLKPASGSSVAGVVVLTAKDGKVEVHVKASGLAPGDHGFHVHEKGDCSAPDASSAGGHFNPASVEHGAPEATPHHAGDFGNLTADASGNVDKSMTVDFLMLGGPNSAIGKAFIIHEKPDDMKTQPTGNAGARVACGVIEAR
jgi:superoxide dismutase, Cu-Zn family